LAWLKKLRRESMSWMTRVIMTGHAEWNGEAFDFKVGDWAGAIGLVVRRTGGGSSSETGGGLWPSIEKAQSIADEIVKKLLSPDCVIEWTGASSN
jgi:hypothetical protein